ncbi:MAG: ABC transporter ATP-binding protein [Lentisphaeria bacterium]|nr:ABC transporter ATP-binding protein [Lentisphaeria bacterium]
MRAHHRHYPYRPPRKIFLKAPRDLYTRFLRDYLSPHWGKILVAFLLIGMNACGPYLMAFYGQIIVDDILSIDTGGKAAVITDGDRSWAGHRPAPASKRPRQGLGRRLDAAELPARSPEAGRQLFVMFILYIGSIVGLNYLARIAQRQSIRVSRDVALSMRDDMHKKIMDLSLRFHQTTTPGRLLSRITSDVDVIQNQTMQAVMLGSRSIFMLIIGFFILFIIDWRIGVAFLLVAPVYGLLYRHFKEGIRFLNRELRHTNSCLYGLVTQKIEGVKATQAYGREGLERLNLHRLCACFLRDSVNEQGKTAALQSWGRVVSGMTSSLIFLFAVHLVLNHELTLGEMLFVHGTVANLFMPILELTQLSIIINGMQVTLGRMMDVLTTQPEIVEAPDAKPVPRPLTRGIRAHDVSFSYGEGGEEDVLKSIELWVPAGSWLCLMGASGCGKSTMLFLLSRLYQPRRGRIRYDDVPLEKISMASLRENVGFVPQTPQIFSGTIRDNITYGKPDASPAEIMRAAKMAEMHDVILDMPVQYETVVGERGTSLSGGQRQRLALARALLTDPEILLLDDCTSALDAATEKKIQETLAANLRGRTAVIASQRVSMARRCDQIAVLENGVISEIGSHDQLVKNGGFYARLNARQTEG